MRVLFVGLGSISTRHIKNLVSVCKERDIDLDIDILRRKIGELPSDFDNICVKQIDNISNSSHYDIAFITNPSNLHYEILSELNELVDFYFIEKPLFESVDYLLDELNITESNAYIACPMRHTKVYETLKKIISDKNVYSSRILCSSYLPDWRPNQDYRKNYSAIKSLGGGVTLDLIHEIDYMVDLFGFPSSVVNIHGKYSHLEIDSDDLSVYLASYKDKIVEVHLDYFGRKSRRVCEVFTTDGTYRADFIGMYVELPSEDKIDCSEEVNMRYIKEINYFMDFINNKVKNINSPEKAYKVLSVTLGNYKD